MANEELTIAKEKARLTVIGNSYPDTLTDSGLGLDLSQIIFDILIDLGLDLPDIDFDDLDDITVIIGIDPDTEIVTLEYPDPDFDPDIDPDDLPDILDYPLPDLDWDDFIDNLEDLGIDPNTLTDLSFTGLDDLGIPELVSLDVDFNIQMDELPASIEIVTPPNKLEYQDGELIDLTGMVVMAKKEDGSTWTSAKYPNGHIPLPELIIDPKTAEFSGYITAEEAGETYKLSVTDNVLNVGWHFSNSTINRRVGANTQLQTIVDGSIGVLVGVGEMYTEPGDVSDEFFSEPAGYHAQQIYFGTDKPEYLYKDETIYRPAGSSAQETLSALKAEVQSSSYIQQLKESAQHVALNYSYTKDEKTVYINGYNGNLQNHAEPAPTNQVGSYFGGKWSFYGWFYRAMWDALYGSKRTNTIAVSWQRPGDELMLSTSFDIKVNKSDQEGNGGR